MLRYQSVSVEISDHSATGALERSDSGVGDEVLRSICVQSVFSLFSLFSVCLVCFQSVFSLCSVG